MTVWVVTFEHDNDFATLVGVYDTEVKAVNAAVQYLEDFGYSDITEYGCDGPIEWWCNKEATAAIVIEHTRVV